MAWKVIWTRRGGLSLEEAYEYVAADDPDAADKLLAGIFETVDLLQQEARLWLRQGLVAGPATGVAAGVASEYPFEGSGHGSWLRKEIDR